VLGVTYKRDIDDIRESPSLDVMAVLESRGARVAYSDPHVPELPARAWAGGRTLDSVALGPATLAAFDCVAILTDHSGVDYDLVVEHADLVVDTRNTVKRAAPHVFKLGAPGRALMAGLDDAAITRAG